MLPTDVSARRASIDALCMFVAYLAFAEVSFLFVFPDVRIAGWWLPSGLTFAVLSRTSVRRWPALGAGIFGAEVVCTLARGYPLPLSVAWGLADAVEPAIGAALLRRAVGARPALATVKEVLALAAAGTLGAFVGGLLVAPATVAFLPDARASSAFAAWFVGDVAGILTIGSLGIAWTSEPLRRPRPRVLVEGVILVFGLAGTSHAIFAGSGSAVHIAPLPYIVFPFTMWAALRFGPRGASLAYTLIAAIASFHTARGAGPFSVLSPPPTERLVTVELFLLVNLTALVLAASHRTQQDALRARDDFLALAAHELRTPLSPLGMALTSVRNRIGNRVPEAMTRLDLAERQVARLTRLTEDLLDTARITRGNVELHRERVELGALAREICEDLPDEARRASQSLTVTGGPAWVCGDRLRLAEILTNLVVNAIKYGDGLPVEVTVARTARDTAMVEVTDHGRGIPEEAQARIFDRFTRLESVGHIPGLGLGLYLAKSLVEAHGGRIGVRSVEGQGATFAVELPVGTIDEALLVSSVLSAKRHA